MPEQTTPTNADLITTARAHLRHAYAPYSKFEMGAAVATADGAVIGGALVENVSLGLAMCAERVALFTCSAAGMRPVRLALAAPKTAGTATWPCGACLQVALELGGRELVVVVGDDDDGPVETATVGDLLPRGPKVR